MPLIITIAGQRLYTRGGQNQALTQIYAPQGWRYIKDRSEVANLFTMTIPEPCLLDGTRFVPAVRDSISVYQNEADFSADTRWFGGLVTSIQDQTRQDSGSAFYAAYAIEAQGFDIILDKELRQPQMAGMHWDALIITLLQAHFSTQLSTDYSGITNPLPAPPIRINNGSLRTLLKAMRQLTHYDYTVDAYQRLHVFQALNRPAAFEINDQPASGITVWQERPTLTHTGRSIYNIVRQPFQALTRADEWAGESFSGKGDPTGQGGQLPLLRTPANIDETTFLDDKFDGSEFNVDRWIEIDDTLTHHVDYPLQGYIFPAEGQCQIVGGTGSLGTVALISQDFYPFTNAAYIVQEFQLTSASGEGYIALFSDGGSLTNPAHFKAGLRVTDGTLTALDGTVLIGALGTTENYIVWTIMTATGWQYEIQGGVFATKQTIYTETATHATDYKVAAIINKNLQGSINSFRFRTSDRGVILEINGQKKVVGLESTDTDLPDIDAFLNVDETPALLKFRGAEAVALIATVASATQFNVVTGQGLLFKPGQRLLIIDSIIESTNGRAGIVATVSGDTVSLVSMGISDLATGQEILINTTVPAFGDKISVRYGYFKDDEAVATDQASIARYGPYPVTLDSKDHIKRFDDAQTEADNYLDKYKDGILTLTLTSNSSLIPEPDTLTAVSVNLTKRPNPVQRALILQRVEIAPISGTAAQYTLKLESSDPVTPFDDQFATHSLVIGTDGVIRFSVTLNEIEASAADDLALHAVTSAYITWDNPDLRRWGEFKWKP